MTKHQLTGFVPLAGIWLAETTKLNFAIVKQRHLIKCIKDTSLLEPEFRMATTAALSD